MNRHSFLGTTQPHFFTMFFSTLMLAHSAMSSDRGLSSVGEGEGTSVSISWNLPELAIVDTTIPVNSMVAEVVQRPIP